MSIRTPAICLDIGCNWGRWCIGGAKAGFTMVGIDPQLGAVLAARRVARQLGVEALFVCADGRFLPFASDSFDLVFSYSVLQHLSETDVNAALVECHRVLKKGGSTMIQMPTAFGARPIYQQARRGFRKTKGFEVRYWTIPKLRRTFKSRVGPVSFEIDCFFGIGLQAADIRLMRPLTKIAIWSSEFLKKLGKTIRVLLYLADSVYVKAVKI